MKLSKRQQKIQNQIGKLLLAGIPLTMLVPLKMEGKEASQNRTRGVPPEIPAIKKDLGGQTQIYVVRPRDTLSGIARKTNSSVKELCRLNNIPANKIDKIFVGQKLIVPKCNIKNERKNNVHPLGGTAPNVSNEKQKAEMSVGYIAAPESNETKEMPPARTLGKPKK